MHNGMLRFTGEKMSKSLGNVATIREVLDTWGAETTLVFFLSAHWRKPIDFSEETMAAAAAQAETLRNALRGDTRTTGNWDELVAVLEDDFNTPAALAQFHEWARDGALDELRRALDVFGLASLARPDTAPASVVELAERRVRARETRDWDEADRLRAEIEAAGWEVRDTNAPPHFQLVRRAA
jgi:cysteinyl-tRNA synthetase